MTTSASKSRTIYEIAQQLGYNKDGNVAYDYLRCRSRKGAFGKSAPRVQGELTGPHSWNIQYQIWLGSKLINTALDQMCIVVVWKTACRLSLLPHHIFALPLPNQVVFLPKLNQIVLAPNLDLTLNLTKLWLKTYFKIPENNKITQAKVNRYSDHRLRELDVFSNFVHHFIPCIIYDFLKDLQQRSCPKTA